MCQPEQCAMHCMCYDCVKIEISERGYTHLNVLHLVCVCVFEIQVAGADCGLDLCILFICSRPGEKPQQQNRIGASRIQTKSEIIISVCTNFYLLKCKLYLSMDCAQPTVEWFFFLIVIVPILCGFVGIFQVFRHRGDKDTSPKIRIKHFA